MNTLQFADNVTMTELNPHNFALKNDYISNLISTALKVVPYANSMFGSHNIKVKRGFLSRSYIQEELLNTTNTNISDLYKHAEGLGITISWINFDSDSAIALCNEVAIANATENIKMVISNQSVTFTFDNEKTEIGEVTKDGYRIVKVYK